METVGLSGQNSSHLERNVALKQVKAFQKTLNAFRAKNAPVIISLCVRFKGGRSEYSYLIGLSKL